jgi:hypothetical protein
VDRYTSRWTKCCEQQDRLPRFEAEKGTGTGFTYCTPIEGLVKKAQVKPKAGCIQYIELEANLVKN